AARAAQPRLGVALARTLGKAGRAGEGEAILLDLARTQDNPEIQVYLGNALYAQNRLAEAEAAYRKALALRPDYAEAHWGLGATLYDRKRPAEAEAAFRKTLALRPDDPKAYYNLGLALSGRNRPA